MERRSGFLTFLSALIPGVGYMYLGLVKKGVQTLILFLLIEPVFRLLSIGYLADIVQLPFWFFTFFDTFSIARRLDRGEYVPDSEFIFKKYTEGDVGQFSANISRNFLIYFAYALIIIGVLAIVDKLFNGYEIYSLIKSYVSTYFFPVLFVLAGIYLLFKNKK